MTLRPENPKHVDDDSKQVFTNDEASLQLPDLTPKKPDPERDDQVKGGRYLMNM